MKAASIRSIERESAKQDHSGDGIVRLSDAGTREIVVNEALRSEPAEQPLHDAMLKVKMDNFLIEVAGISKHNRANGRRPAPIPDLLIKPARQAQGVQSMRPGGIGTGTPIESRKLEPLRLLWLIWQLQQL